MKNRRKSNYVILVFGFSSRMGSIKDETAVSEAVKSTHFFYSQNQCALYYCKEIPFDENF